MEKKIIKFIKANNLEFNGGSGGDINILAVCGYATHLDATLEELCIAVNSTDDAIIDELTRVYNYAKAHNYKKYWSTPAAKEAYKF